MGLWNLEAMETGTLTFTFALDPHAFKKEMSAINKLVAAAAENGKPITDPAKLKPKPKEFVTAKTLSRNLTQPTMFEKLVRDMLKNYRDENYSTNEVIIKDLLTKQSLWTNQAYELLRVFKE